MKGLIIINKIIKNMMMRINKIIAFSLIIGFYLIISVSLILTNKNFDFKVLFILVPLTISIIGARIIYNKFAKDKERTINRLFFVENYLEEKNNVSIDYIILVYINKTISRISVIYNLILVMKKENTENESSSLLTELYIYIWLGFICSIVVIIPTKDIILNLVIGCFLFRLYEILLWAVYVFLYNNYRINNKRKDNELPHTILNFNRTYIILFLNIVQVVLIYGSIYFLNNNFLNDSSDRMGSLGKIDCLYFSATTFFTSSYGDIYATNEYLRIICISEMCFFILLIGVLFSNISLSYYKGKK